MFDVTLFDEFGVHHELSQVKIGFIGQTTSTPTYRTFLGGFESLPEQYFSLGTDLGYYKKLNDSVSEATRNTFLSALRDIVFDQSLMDQVSGEEVFRTSLLRYVGLSVVTGQYRRIISGEAPLTDFRFNYTRAPSDSYTGIDLSFVVEAGSKPSTNIHAVIGRNGVGKTTLLNDMIDAIMRREGALGLFASDGLFGITSPLPADFFASLVSVSFSAFDPFTPPVEQPHPELGTCYSYIGLKDPKDQAGRLKELEELRAECVSSIGECFGERAKRDRWLAAIKTLGSDDNFAQMELSDLVRYEQPEERKKVAQFLVKKMSAGHALVLLTISKLVARVDEKTLVLLDEPESHLHPPLLSAFTRALSELLHNRNGLAIVATHSPVVLQEVPRSCVTIIERRRLAISAHRPSIETFGENVGVLTREVFGLEVTKSGFHSLLERDVAESDGYDNILSEYNGHLGQEARGILRAMVSAKKAGR